MIIKSKNVSIKALALGGLLASSSSFAQIEEVVVTAEFRETNVQDTPLAITAISGDMLEARNQTNLVQVSAQAPNVNLNPAGVGNGPAMVAFIRGVGQTDFNYAVEPGVGIYVDDVYYPTLTGSLIDLLDVSRLEVLRGPQGTLAGKNSIGGSIKLFSKKPGEDEGGRISVTHGSYDRLDFSGAADVQISDSLWARFSGTSKAEDGHVKRLDYACVTGDTNFPTYLGNGDINGCQLGTEGGRNVTALRTAFRWEASDSVEVNFAYDHVNEDSEPAAGVLIEVNEALAATKGFVDASGPRGLYILGLDGTTQYPLDNRFVTHGPSRQAGAPINDPYATYSTYIDPNQSPADPTAPDGSAQYSVNPWAGNAIAPETNLNQHGWSAIVDWEINDHMSLKSITSARKYVASWAQDADASPVHSDLLIQVLDHEQKSQEIRLLGDLFDGLLDYTVGGFYFDQEGTLNASVNIPYAGLNFIHGPDPTPSTTKAIFANTTWHFIDSRLNLTAGLRYSEEEKDYVFFRRNIDGTVPANAPCAVPGVPGHVTNEPNCALAGLFDVSAHFEDERTDWRLALDYAFTDDLMGYVQASTGYKGGGINPRPFFTVQIFGVNPEELTAYEVGFKSILFDSRLRLNGSYFINDYTDIQLQLNQCVVPFPPFFGGPCLGYGNVGDADVSGIELEAELDLGNWIIDASLATLDFEYTSVASNTSVTDDMITPFTPELSYSLGVQYNFDLSDGGQLSARLDYSYKDEMFSNATNSEHNRMDDLSLLNGRVVWADADREWELFGEINNLTDEVYYNTIYDTWFQEAEVTGNIAKPRTWAVGINYHF